MSGKAHVWASVKNSDPHDRALRWRCKNCGTVYVFRPTRRRDRDLLQPNYHRMLAAGVQMDCDVALIQGVLET